MEDVEQEVQYLMCWAANRWGQRANSAEKATEFGRNILQTLLTSHAGPLRNTPLFILPICSNLMTGEVEHARQTYKMSIPSQPAVVYNF